MKRTAAAPQGKWHLTDYLRNYRFNSIFVRNLLIIFLLIVLPLGLLNFLYSYNARKMMENEISQVELQSLYRSAAVMDAVFRDLYDLSYSLSTSQETQRFMLRDLEALKEGTLVYDLHTQLRFFTNTYGYIDSVYIYAENTGLVIYRGEVMDVSGITDNSWLEMYREMDDTSFVIRSRRKNDFYPYFMSLICPVKFNTGKLAGAVVVNINIENLGTFVNGSRLNDQEMFIVGDDGILYYYSNYRKFGEDPAVPEYLAFLNEDAGDFAQLGRVGGSEAVVACVHSGVQPLRYVSVRPLTYYAERMGSFSSFWGQMMLTSLVLCLAVSFLATLLAFRPIRNLVSAIEKPIALNAGMGEEQKLNEIEHIKRIVLNARAASSRLEMELEERMEKLHNAQLRALQNQINPHFLYNTLDAIRWAAVAKLGGENEISDMITPLAQLMRAGLECESYLVAVREEIQHVKLYLQIFDLRYRDRLSVQWQIDEEVLEQRIVKLSMQPLVENAIYHGLRPKRYRGSICICAAISGPNVMISVHDDGVGMDEKITEELNRHMQTEYLFDDRFVGLRNVNQRFKLIYGEEYGVTVSPREDDGVTVTLVFPKDFEKKL